MIEARADIELGEAFRPAALAHRRVHSGGARAVLLPALALAGAIIASSLIGMVLPLISLRLEGLASLLWIAGGILGLMAALRILARQQLRGFLMGLRRLGSPERFPTRFLFDDQGITVDNSRLSYRLPWSSVLFVMPAPEHWLIQIDTTTLAVPTRAFAGPAEVQAFLDLAQARLSPEARSHSVFARQ
jgi:hypothetical protein